MRTFKIVRLEAVSLLMFVTLIAGNLYAAVPPSQNCDNETGATLQDYIKKRLDLFTGNFDGIRDKFNGSVAVTSTVENWLKLEGNDYDIDADGTEDDSCSGLDCASVMDNRPDLWDGWADIVSAMAADDGIKASYYGHYNANQDGKDACPSLAQSDDYLAWVASLAPSSATTTSADPNGGACDTVREYIVTRADIINADWNGLKAQIANNVTVLDKVRTWCQVSQDADPNRPNDVCDLCIGEGADAAASCVAVIQARTDLLVADGFDLAGIMAQDSNIAGSYLFHYNSIKNNSDELSRCPDLINASDFTQWLANNQPVEGATPTTTTTPSSIASSVTRLVKTGASSPLNLIPKLPAASGIRFKAANSEGNPFSRFKDNPSVGGTGILTTGSNIVGTTTDTTASANPNGGACDTVREYILARQDLIGNPGEDGFDSLKSKLAANQGIVDTVKTWCVQAGMGEDVGGCDQCNETTMDSSACVTVLQARKDLISNLNIAGQMAADSEIAKSYLFHYDSIKGDSSQLSVCSDLINASDYTNYVASAAVASGDTTPPAGTTASADPNGGACDTVREYILARQDLIGNPGEDGFDSLKSKLATNQGIVDTVKTWCVQAGMGEDVSGCDQCNETTMDSSACVTVLQARKDLILNLDIAGQMAADSEIAKSYLYHYDSIKGDSSQLSVCSDLINASDYTNYLNSL